MLSIFLQYLIHHKAQHIYVIKTFFLQYLIHHKAQHIYVIKTFNVWFFYKRIIKWKFFKQSFCFFFVPNTHFYNKKLFLSYFFFTVYKNFNLDSITNEDNAEHNSKWPYIPNHPCKILIIGASGSGKKMHYLI